MRQHIIISNRYFDYNINCNSIIILCNITVFVFICLILDFDIFNNYIQ